MGLIQSLTSAMKKRESRKAETAKIDAAQAEMSNMRRERQTVQRASATMAQTPSAAKTLLGQ